jgi:ribose/xylose/arabinose/galactoside ABC-type transport system permease subunit
MASVSTEALPRRFDWGNLGLLAVVVLLIIGFSLASPHFLSFGNITNMLLTVSVIGVMAAVSTLVIVGRELDLSVGSVAALVGVVVALLVEAKGWPASAGLAAGIAVGALAGLFNGFMVASLNVNSIITTIGTLALFRGIAFIVTDGQTAMVQNESILTFGFGRVLGVPYSVWILVLVFIGAHFVAQRTAIGRSIFAIGASPRAALLSGLNLKSMRYGMFLASGVSAGLAGILLIGQSGAAVPSGATGYELQVITAVLLGGTSLAGGEGSVLRTALGVLVIGILNNGMVLLNVPSFYQIAANGVLLLVAVSIDQLRIRRGSFNEER